MQIKRSWSQSRKVTEYQNLGQFLLWVGPIEKGIEKHVEQIQGSPNLAEMQNMVLTGTAHILKKTSM